MVIACNASWSTSATASEQLFKAVIDGHLGHLKKHLKQGADPNKPDHSGMSALYYAMDNDDHEAIRILRGFGAIVTKALMTTCAQRRLQTPGSPSNAVLRSL